MLELWGKDENEEKVFLHTIKNNQGMEVRLSNFAAIVHQVRMPSEKFGVIDTVLSYPRFEYYLADKFFLGAVCGRYCNRIANAKFELNDQSYSLSKNEEKHHLHGGEEGFYKKTWTVLEASKNHFQLELISPDGDQGYPGELKIIADYFLNENNQLIFSWLASTDHDTPVCLTNHSYFNLAGFGDIKNHSLTINCDSYTPVDSESIPEGTVEPVDGSAFDFRKGKLLDDVLSCLPKEFEASGGLDHHWVASQSADQVERRLAEIYCPDSGLGLAVSSTLPGLQCYTGNHLASSSIFGSHEGICLESQPLPLGLMQ